MSLVVSLFGLTQRRRFGGFFNGLLSLSIGVSAILLFLEIEHDLTNSKGDHKGYVNGDVAQACSNEAETEEVASLGLPDNVCEAP